MSIEEPSIGHLPDQRFSSPKSLDAGLPIHSSQVFMHTGPAVWQVVAWALLSLGAALVAIVNFNAYQVGTYIDDVSYIVLARSLLEADQYGLIHLPGIPGVTQFPFGFPLLLAPLVSLFGGEVVPLRLFSLVATLANGALLFWFWPRLTRSPSYSWALAVVGLYLFSPTINAHARMVMSEPIFTTAYLVAILLAERVAEGRSGIVGKVGLGGVLFMALFTRTVGFTLVFAVALYLMYRRRWKAVQDLAWVGLTGIVLLAAVIGLTPVTTANVIPSQYLTLGDSLFFRQALAPFIPSLTALEPQIINEEYPPVQGNPDGTNQDYLVYNLRQHLGNDIRQVVLPYGIDKLTALANQLGLPILFYVPGALIVLVLAIGFYKLTRLHGLPLFMFFALVYLGTVFFWIWEGGRLLYPIFPQILFSFLAGLSVLVGWVVQRLPFSNPQRAAQVMLLGCFGLLLGASLIKAVDADHTLEHVGDLEQRTEWVRTHLPAGSVLLSEASILDFYYGEHKTFPYPFWASSQEKLEAYLNRGSATHILVAPQLKWSSQYTPAYSPLTLQLLPFFEGMISQGRLVELYVSESGWLRVYQIRE